MADSAATFLNRMVANAHEALHQGASPDRVVATLLALARGIAKPTQAEDDDAAEVLELVNALNTFRSHQPGELPDPMHDGTREVPNV